MIHTKAVAECDNDPCDNYPKTAELEILKEVFVELVKILPPEAYTAFHNYIEAHYEGFQISVKVRNNKLTINSFGKANSEHQEIELLDPGCIDKAIKFVRQEFYLMIDDAIGRLKRLKEAIK